MLLAVQSRHTAPVAPHAAPDAPAEQVPLTASEQQPPLQACWSLQLVVHMLVLVSQARPLGQSAAELHPHLLGAPGMQACPTLLAVQSEQTAPVSQAPPVVPD
jgi:hypothetical protein